jgi:hypothetical protein
MYVDGLFDSEASYDSNRNYLNSLQFWRIASDKVKSGIVDVVNGFIDDVRFYRRALSASEVQQLYAYESGFFGLRVNLIKAVEPSFSGLTLTTNYPNADFERPE